MYNVLGGILLFASVCGIGLLIAFFVQSQTKHSRHWNYRTQDKYLQFKEDKYALNKLGYAQQLRRYLNGFGSFGVSFTTMSVISGAALYFGPMYGFGGPWTFGIGWPLVSLFALLVAAAAAELASAMPTSGGVYHWSRAAGGKAWAWAAAALRGAGDIGLLLIINGIAAVLIDSLLAAWLGYRSSSLSMLAVGVLVLGTQLLVSSRGVYWLHWLTSCGVWLQIGLIVAIIGGLAWTIGPYLQPVEYLFALGPEGSGKTGLVQIVLALVLIQRLFMGGDAAAYTTEETYNPKVHAPWSIYLTAAYGFVFGYILFAYIVMAAGGLPGFHLENTSFLALTVSLWGAWNPVMNTLLFIGIILSLWSSGLGIVNTSSRMWFAYHRDGRSQLSRWMAAVSVKHQTPKRIMAVFGIVAMLAMAAASGIIPWHSQNMAVLPPFWTAWCIICLNGSAAIPIGLRLMRAKEEYRQLLLNRVWSLGAFSLPVHWLAFLWLSATTVAAAVFLSAAAAGGIAALLALAALFQAVRKIWNGQQYVGMQLSPTPEEMIRVEKSYRQF
ncbi:amino acid permease [Paenibacillaceae bacterium]|nr:amino acid permease [Paenibacillaceae bacterium]